MSPENFVYWLQGCLELTKTESLSKEQVDMIKTHIKLVLYPVVQYNFPPFKMEDIKPIHGTIYTSDKPYIKYDDITKPNTKPFELDKEKYCIGGLIKNNDIQISC